ncbi:hypothetical protein Tco_1311656 [Tanacetum coccineum]
MVAFLNKSEGSEDFHQIIDFLNISHIKYALTENPTIYTSLIQQFWETASASTSENEEMEITATIDGRVKTITEASIRRHLKLEDSDGIPTLPNAKIFEQLALMGYASDSDKLTFQKGHFSPQWRFLIHTILHCLSPKKTAWEQFSSNIATAIICLATNRTFNFSKMIFEGMLKNLDSRSKFLMYPRFIQIFLNKHKRHLLPHKRTYVAPTLTQKLFSNMRRVSKGYTGVNIPLFPTMLTASESSPSRITSSPSLSPQSHLFMKNIHDAEEPTTMPHDSSQPRVQSLGSDEGSLTLNGLTVLCTTLSNKVEDLQNDLKQTKLTYGAAYKLTFQKGHFSPHSEDEGTSWTQGRTSADTEILLDQKEPIELLEDPGSGEKGEKEISTASISVSTAGVNTTKAVLSTVIPEFSTAILKRQVYIRRSTEKRKDKGKAIMKDDESVQKKTRKQLEQERLGYEEAIRLQEQINEEERQRIARDVEIAKQLQEEIDIARQEQEKYDLAQALELQKEYHAQQNRSFSKAEVRKNICMYLKNHGGYKQSHFKGMSYEDIRPIFERPPAKRQKVGEVSGSVEEQSAGKEKEVSEEELKKLLVIVPVEEVYIEALQVKYPIIDWEVFTEESRSYWRIIRVGNHTEDLVKKKFSLTEPTIDKEKVLWVELKRLFEPDDDDTLWKLQRYMHDPLKWKLYDTCGVHHVSTERGHDIFMLVEKDYPLTRALMTVMLANKLQVDESLEMENELLRKIFYQVERPRT